MSIVYGLLVGIVLLVLVFLFPYRRVEVWFARFRLYVDVLGSLSYSRKRKLVDISRVEGYMVDADYRRVDSSEYGAMLSVYRDELAQLDYVIKSARGVIRMSCVDGCCLLGELLYRHRELVRVRSVLVGLERDRVDMVDKIFQWRSKSCGYPIDIGVPMRTLADKIESVDLPVLDREISAKRKELLGLRWY